MSSWNSIRAADLAELVGGELIGDGSRTVNGIETLQSATPEQLSWMAGANFATKLAATAAGVVLIPANISPPAGLTVIRVKDPDRALCTVLEHLAPSPPRLPVGVHPTAVVAKDAIVSDACIGPQVTIGEGAFIGPGTQLHAGVCIGDGARLGRDCLLWQNSVVRDRCILGDRVILHAGAVIGADGFGYLFRGGKHVKIPQVGTVDVGDDVEVGANSCIDRAKSGVTRIGRGTKIDNLVQIGHNCEIGEDCVIVAQVGISGSVTVGHHSVFGGQSGVRDHVTVGAGVQVAAQSGILGNVADGAVLFGTPSMNKRDAMKREALSRRLPELFEQLKELSRRIEQLESPTNDRSRG